MKTAVLAALLFAAPAEAVVCAAPPKGCQSQAYENLRAVLATRVQEAGPYAGKDQ